MSEPVHPHPTGEELELFVIGAAEVARAGEIEAHLVHCADCSSRVELEARISMSLLAAETSASFCLACERIASGDRCNQCGAAIRAGRFTIEGVLAQSERGKTYFARSPEGAKFALKESTSPPPMGLAALRHPGLPKSTVTFEDDSRFYLAQEFVEGESLLTHNHLGEDDVVDIARELLEILSYLESVTPAVVHGDLKPANLIRRPNGSLVLVDFGFSSEPNDLRGLASTMMQLLDGRVVSAPLRQFISALPGFASAKEARRALEARKQIRRRPIYVAAAAAAVAIGVAASVDFSAAPPFSAGTEDGPAASPEVPLLRGRGTTATGLIDGKVLIFGGEVSKWMSADRGELYDPLAIRAKITPRAHRTRSEHTATLLGTGAILLAGGRPLPGAKPMPDAELYDPATNTFLLAAPMHEARAGHSATLLYDGRVLVVGPGAELYDPRTNRWTVVPGAEEITSHSATLLRDGRVLYISANNQNALFNPATNTFGRGIYPDPLRVGHTATLLASGAILLAGGCVTPDREGDPCKLIEKTELFDPDTGESEEGPPLRVPRAYHRTLGLSREPGAFLVIGGFDSRGSMVTAIEKYDPSAREFTIVQRDAAAARERPAVAPTIDGWFLVAGGTTVDVRHRPDGLHHLSVEVPIAEGFEEYENRRSWPERAFVSRLNIAPADRCNCIAEELRGKFGPSGVTIESGTKSREKPSGTARVTGQSRAESCTCIDRFSIDGTWVHSVAADGWVPYAAIDHRPR